jgi:hypothetical protein
MDCQPLGNCHADCHLDVSAPKSANFTTVSAAFKVGIPCLVSFNGAYSVHPNEPLVVVIHEELVRLTGEDGFLTFSLQSIANFTAVSTTFWVDMAYSVPFIRARFVYSLITLIV